MLSEKILKKVTFILLIIYVPFIFTPLIYQAVLIAEEDTTEEDTTEEDTTEEDTLRDMLQDALTVVSRTMSVLAIIADTIVEYENSIADDNQQRVGKYNKVTSITNEIASLDTAEAQASSNLRSLKRQVEGIDVDIAHEGLEISTANYYISNPNVSQTVREHWMTKRQAAQGRIADLESQKTGINTQIASEEANIASIQGQISSKWIERSLVQEEISRIDQEISRKKNHIAYQRALLPDKTTEYLEAILTVDEIEREIAAVIADRAYYESLLAAELAKSPSEQNKYWILNLRVWISECNKKLGE